MTTLRTQTGSAFRPFHVEFPEEAFAGAAAGVMTPRQQDRRAERPLGRTP